MKKDQHAKSEENAAARSLIQIAETLSDNILRATIPLYYEADKGQPTLLGSGVLLSLDGTRFLLTAGHVLDHLATKQLAVGVPAGLLTVAGFPTRLRSLGAETEEDDRIDVGMMRLQGAPWDKLHPGAVRRRLTRDPVARASEKTTHLSSDRDFRLTRFRNSLSQLA